jgi:hypothetical protein
VESSVKMPTEQVHIPQSLHATPTPFSLPSKPLIRSPHSRHLRITCTHSQRVFFDIEVGGQNRE